MFKHNNENARTTLLTSFRCFCCWVEHISHLFPSISLVDFEQVNVSLVTIGSSKQRQILASFENGTPWKVSVSGFFPVRIFPHSDWNRTDMEYRHISRSVKFRKTRVSKAIFFLRNFKRCWKLGSRDAENNYNFCQFIFNFRQVLFARKS